MSSESKPQASQHMLWFFVLPALAFIGFVGFKLIGSSTQDQPQTSFEQKLENIETAKSPGDRWQAAYALAQDLQQKIRSGELEAMTSEQKSMVYTRLDTLLETHTTDARLKKYLLLTLGQMGDIRAIISLKRGIDDPDPEVQFFSAWGFLEILQALKNEGKTVPAEELEVVSGWLKSKDPGFRKIASTFLVQQNQPMYINQVVSLLSDEDAEVRWNAAVALASVKDARAKSTMLEMFDLKKIRELEMRSTKDLKQLVEISLNAAKKIWDKDFDAALSQLELRADPKTPEGGAIHAAIKAM
jgi:HEAT repeat protein